VAGSALAAGSRVGGRETVEQDGELYVLAKSEGRRAKETAMRRKRLAACSKSSVPCAGASFSGPAADALGCREISAGRAFQFVQMRVPEEGQQVTRETFQFRVDKKKLQEAEWRDGHTCCAPILPPEIQRPVDRYVQLTQIESVFRSLKSELGIRPIYHQLEHRADAHILIAFLAYCLQVTLKQRLLLHAPGLTPTAVLEKLAEIKMIDVWIPTVDQRWLILPRYTQPSSDTSC